MAGLVTCFSACITAAGEPGLAPFLAADDRMTALLLKPWPLPSLLRDACDEPEIEGARSERGLVLGEARSRRPVKGVG